jgi:hypothetical protein
VLHAVSVTTSRGHCTVSVELRRGREQAVAVAEGPSAGGGLDRVVAEATVRAAASFDPGAAGVAVEAVQITVVGARSVATAALAHPLGAGEEPLAGAAVVGADGAPDAVARAVLRAVAGRTVAR